MDQAQSPIVDFHSHFVGPSLPLTTLKGLCGPQRAAWERINARLTDAGALLASLEQGGVAARIISSPPEFIEDAGGNVPQDGYRRINDAVADLVGKHPGRLYGLASVDAYGGEPSARELERGVRQLGLRGVFMPSAKGDLLPDAEAARPTLAAAAALQIPVFLHPVADGQLFARFKRFGPLGMRLTRGTINSARYSPSSKAVSSKNCRICASWLQRSHWAACCSPARSATARNCMLGRRRPRAGTSI